MDKLRAPNVAIVGFSESTRHLVPFADPKWEVWVLNRLPIVLAKEEKNNNWDRSFDLHTLDESTRQQAGLCEDDWKELLEFIRQDHGARFGRPRLVYVDGPTEDMPSARQFPFEEVLAGIGRRYIASGIAWEIAYAILLKPKKLALYGIDLKSDEEWSYQRPNVEWLLGIAEGRGIEVILPEASAVLNSDGTCSLYGSPDDPKGIYAEVEHFAMKRMTDLYKEIDNRKKLNEQTFNELHLLTGQKGELEFLIHRLRMKRRGGVL